MRRYGKVYFREHLSTPLTLGFIAIAPLCFAQQMTATQPAAKTASATGATSGAVSALPPAPAGKTTVIGGEIRNLDPVRDQFNLKVFGGGKPIKVLFDARTQMYRDGKRVSLKDLHANEHASVETVLDGTNIYALSIHMLSRSPEGNCQGQVLNYNPDNGELTISGALTREPIRLVVPAGTPIVREGQNKFAAGSSGPSDLVPGALVSVDFRSGNGGRGVASHVAVLAVPGSAFLFTGDISVLDMHTGSLTLTDPTENRTYQVFFDPARFSGLNLHEGQHVSVTAEFNGTHYVAQSIR